MEMLILKSVSDYARFCNIRIGELEERLKGYPEGDFHCYHNGSAYTRWISYKNKKRRYIRKSDQALTQVMAEKKLHIFYTYTT